MDKTDPSGELSFLVARPLDFIVGAAFLMGHTFVVSNARYIGDPQATVYSFGPLQNGNLGNISNGALARSGAENTSAVDYGAWLSIGVRGGESNITQINAPDSVVDATSASLSETNRYAAVPDPSVYNSEANSNSAAFAVGDRSTQVATGDATARVDRQNFSLTLPGQASSDKINFNQPNAAPEQIPVPCSPCITGH